jgi:hypothetical protein
MVCKKIIACHFQENGQVYVAITMLITRQLYTIVWRETCKITTVGKIKLQTKYRAKNGRKSENTVANDKRSGFYQ